LYEIAQKYPVALLTEELDSETKKILSNKKFFPKLKEIIITAEPFEGKIFSKNFKLYKTIKMAVNKYKPTIVVSTDDTYPGSLYLMRLAKKEGAKTVAFQSGFQIAEGNKLYLWSCFLNCYLKMPKFLPFFLKMFFVKLKKYLGHFFYYWIMPLTVGEKPFLGKTSLVFWKISAGLKEADYVGVFSERERALHIKDGIPFSKIFTLGHPLTHKKTKEFLERAYSLDKSEIKERLVVIMWPNENISFNKKDFSLISKNEIQKIRNKIIKIISKELNNRKILIKPHPGYRKIEEVKKVLNNLPLNVRIIHPLEPADKYFKMGEIIIGFPPPSTALFTASLQYPEKVILYLDLNQEFLGGAYKNFNGIEYIDNEDDFIHKLKLIKEGKYKKEIINNQKLDFSDASEMLEVILNGRMSNLKKIIKN